MKTIVLWLLTAYKAIVSPFLHAIGGGGNYCIYQPTCSEYTHAAVMKYGATKGLILGLKRILRCNPFHKGGYDPVP